MCCMCDDNDIVNVGVVVHGNVNSQGLTKMVDSNVNLQQNQGDNVSHKDFKYKTCALCALCLQPHIRNMNHNIEKLNPTCYYQLVP